MAAFFGKRHADVLRDLEVIAETLSEQICSQWFRPVETAVRVGFGTRMDRAFDMTRDGFTLLVMGYTGAKALAFKVAYIQRFNEMEEALREAPAPAGEVDARGA